WRVVSYGNCRVTPPIQVALHQVRAPQVDLICSAVREIIDAAVFEEPAHDAADGDILAQPRHAGAQATDAARDQVDLPPGLRGAIQQVDRQRVHHRVELENQPAAPPARGVGDLALDQSLQTLAQVHGRHQQLTVAALARVAG